MDQKHTILQEASTVLTYSGAAFTAVMAFFSVYATAISAICVCVTCAANIYYQRRRLAVLEKQRNPVDDSF